MIEALNDPFNIGEILRKRKTLKAELSKTENLIESRVAILGGSTTSEIKALLELFLLKGGIRPTFHESEYNRYFEEAVIDNEALKTFRPDIIFIHTTQINATNLLKLGDSEDRVNELLQAELARYQTIWTRLESEIGCVIIQNNFDYPRNRSMGNRDAIEHFGRTHYLTRLNLEFAARARSNSKLQINDINYLSAVVGLDAWHDPVYWYSYKMAVSQMGSVAIAKNVSVIIKSVYGMTKKCLVLDLDNTLWGGVIGDDGVQNIQLGKETPNGEAYTAFQRYCLELGSRGILLAVCSKNELKNAKEGFGHPDAVLKLENISSFKANWNPKHENIVEIAREINIGLDSLVFVDDNPAERAIVSGQLPMVQVPDVGSDVSRYIDFLDREGHFEPTRLSQDDFNRASYYADNNQRAALEATFTTYGDFLRSLDMKAEIKPFHATYLDRIAQLTNKTNQFNLTTRRYTFAEMETLAGDPRTITLYGRLSDKFGDNGLVSVVVGKKLERELHIDLWLMSCRVLKRDMELAMLDELVARAKLARLEAVFGYYFRTAKNEMVTEHYGRLGFDLVSRGDSGKSSTWKLELSGYEPKNRFIKEINRESIS